MTNYILVSSNRFNNFNRPLTTCLLRRGLDSTVISRASETYMKQTNKFTRQVFSIERNFTVKQKRRIDNFIRQKEREKNK